MDSEDNQPLNERQIILPFIALFFVNILLICYELNTGFEHNSDEMIIFKVVYILIQVWSAMNTGLLVHQAGFFIGLNYDLFCETYNSFIYMLSVISDEASQKILKSVTV